MLPVSYYPASAQRVLAAYRRQFHEQPEAYALFGYEAMSATLQAIRRAGARGNNRQAVVDALFADGRPRLGDRPLHDRTGRRNHALQLWRRPRVWRSAGVLARAERGLSRRRAGQGPRGYES